MYGAIFSSTSPTIAFNSHGTGTANSFRAKLRPFPATRFFVDEDLEDGHGNGHGFSVHRRLLSALAGNFCALVAVETLEPPTIDITEKTGSKTAIVPELELGGGADDGGGDGRRIGAGQADRGGGDDGKDDDDDGGKGKGGDEYLLLFLRRRLAAELVNGETIESVLREWMRTTKDMPLALKEACAMGILGSATLSRFLWFSLPQSLLDDLNGKVMADRSLPYKLGFEAVCSVFWSVFVDIGSRKRQRTRKEWDLVVTNAILNVTCNVFEVWSLAHCNEQINLPKLPNNVNSVFEKSRKVESFTVWKRLLCFLHKAAAFFALAFAAKSAARICLCAEKISTENLGAMSKDSLAAWISFRLFSILRYQLIWRIDRSLDLYVDVTKVSLAFCLALRFLNIGIGTLTLDWVGSENQANRPDLVDSLISHVGDGLGCDDHWFGLRNFTATGFSQVGTSTKTQLAAKKEV